MALVVNIWSKVAVAVETVRAATKVMSATFITKANPGVVTATAHGYANGDVILITCSGMIEANQMVVEAANITANTFELKGIDTTLFTTCTAGDTYKITLGAAAATMQDVNGTGGEAAAVNITTIHDDTTKEIPGVKSALSYTFGNIWDPADPALVELKKADNVKGERVLKFTFSSAAKLYFNSYPSASLAPGGSTGDVVTTQTSFKLRGPVVAYAS